MHCAHCLLATPYCVSLVHTLPVVPRSGTCQGSLLSTKRFDSSSSWCHDNIMLESKETKQASVPWDKEL